MKEVVPQDLREKDRRRRSRRAADVRAAARSASTSLIGMPRMRSSVSTFGRQ
jgi:hypothetical protein